MPNRTSWLTWQVVAAMLIVITGLGGMIVALAVLAKWDDGAIIGLGSAFGAIAVTSVLQLRNQHATRQTLEAQDEKLETIERQTNGLSTAERQDIAERAAAAIMRRRP
jgi:hypothetical protein